MITVSRLDGHDLVVNADLIELVESTPDTVLSFLHGKKLIVRETPEEVVERVIAYRRRITSAECRVPSAEQAIPQLSTQHAARSTS